MTSPVAGSTPSVINSPPNCENAKGDPVVLRCKSLSGQYVIELSSVSTVEELATKVVAYTGIDRNALSLRFGFPPKRIDLSPEGTKLTLSELKISSGDCITADGAVSTETPQPQTSSSQALHSRLVRKVAPSDNCCLFTSVNFCVSNRDSSRSIEAPVATDADEVQETRMLIANIVLSDPATFNEGILGMPVENYIHGIIQPHRWGGGIEVSILSAVHEVEIDVVDVLTGRIDRFGEDKCYSHRILLLYDGIHYDPLAAEHPDTGTLQTIFLTSQDSVLVEAQVLANDVKRAGQFTDLTNCNLMCSICRSPLRGQQGAQQHAKSTGHTQFQERSRF